MLDGVLTDDPVRCVSLNLGVDNGSDAPRDGKSDGKRKKDARGEFGLLIKSVASVERLIALSVKTGRSA
jgi:hypothetical protein